MKLYDTIKQLLTDYPELRDSDKALEWEVWMREGIHLENREHFIRHATNPESIRRSRQKIQEHFPELRGTPKVQKARAEKEGMKGNHVYFETTQNGQYTF